MRRSMTELLVSAALSYRAAYSQHGVVCTATARPIAPEGRGRAWGIFSPADIRANSAAPAGVNFHPELATSVAIRSPAPWEQ